MRRKKKGSRKVKFIKKPNIVIARIGSAINYFFSIEKRDSSITIELLAGITTFLAMVYSVIVVPNILVQAGFHYNAVFLATCLVAAFGSLLMGLWANLPMAIGCAISLTGFTAFGVILGHHVTIGQALGAVFLMGCCFSIISITGIRVWLLQNIPKGIATGIGIGIGLFLFFIAANSVGLVIRNDSSGLPIKLGNITDFTVFSSILGLAAIIGLERIKVPGAIFIVIIVLSILNFFIQPGVDIYLSFFLKQMRVNDFIAAPNFSGVSHLFKQLDIIGALSFKMLPVIFALIITAVFDATGTIRALAEQAKLLDKKGQIKNSKKALTSDSVSSIFAGLIGTSPAAVYIESAAGTAAGGKTGLTAVVVGCLFLVMLFLAPLTRYIPTSATAPALMYVGLLMLSNVRKLDFSDSVDSLSGLITAIFILLTCNIVTGIMIGFASLCLGRLFSGKWRKLNVNVVIITLILVGYYLSGLAI